MDHLTAGQGRGKSSPAWLEEESVARGNVTAMIRSTPEDHSLERVTTESSSAPPNTEPTGDRSLEDSGGGVGGWCQH